MARTGPQSWSRRAIAAVAISLSAGGIALAQTADGLPNARAQAAYVEWRKLPQSEVNCVDHALRAERTRLWFVIQRGVGPSDGALAKVRMSCGAQAKATSRTVVVQDGSQAMAASVVTVSDKVTPEQAVADKATADNAAAEKAAADKAAAEIA